MRLTGRRRDIKTKAAKDGDGESNASAAVPALMKRAIFAEIAALQTDGNGVFDAQSWADFGALGSRLTKAGVAWKTCELGSILPRLWRRRFATKRSAAKSFFV